MISAERRCTPPVVLLHLQPQPREEDKTAWEEGEGGEGIEEGRGPSRPPSSSTNNRERARETRTHLAHTMLPLEMKFGGGTRAQGACEHRRHNAHANAGTRAGAQGGGDSSRGCHQDSGGGGGEGVGEAGGVYKDEAAGGVYAEESRVYKLSVIILRTGH